MVSGRLPKTMGSADRLAVGRSQGALMGRTMSSLPAGFDEHLEAYPMLERFRYGLREDLFG